MSRDHNLQQALAVGIQSGFAAARAGMPLEANPHPDMDPMCLSEAWATGWHCAMATQEAEPEPASEKNHGGAVLIIIGLMMMAALGMGFVLGAQASDACWTAMDDKIWPACEAKFNFTRNRVPDLGRWIIGG